VKRLEGLVLDATKVHVTARNMSVGRAIQESPARYSRKIDRVLASLDRVEDNAGSTFLERVFWPGGSFGVLWPSGSIRVFRLGRSLTLGERGALLHVFAKGQTLHASVAATNTVGRTVGSQPDTAVGLPRLSSDSCHDWGVGMLVPRAAHKSLALDSCDFRFLRRVLAEDRVAGHAAVVLPSRMPLARWKSRRWQRRRAGRFVKDLIREDRRRRRNKHGREQSCSIAQRE
jgi:hypothetical protein